MKAEIPLATYQGETVRVVEIYGSARKYLTLLTDKGDLLRGIAPICLKNVTYVERPPANFQLPQEIALQKLHYNRCFTCKRRFGGLRKNHKYCSDDCGRRARLAQIRVTPTHRPCKLCKVVFEVKAQNHAHCSEKCAKKAYSISLRRGFTPIPCDWCKKTFTPLNERHKVCSGSCWRKRQWASKRPIQTKPCALVRCGKLFTTRDIGKRFCSRRCSEARCKDRIVPTRFCGVCKGSYITAIPNMVYCSRTCRKLAKAARVQKAPTHVTCKCGVTFKRRSSSHTHCSLKCRKTVVHLTRTCVFLGCGKTFVQKRRDHVYCTRSWSHRNVVPKVPVTVVCKLSGCGVSFLMDHPRHVFCSRKCRNKYHYEPKSTGPQEIRNCVNPICGKAFKPRARPDIYCSAECQRFHRERKNLDVVALWNRKCLLEECGRPVESTDARKTCCSRKCTYALWNRKRRNGNVLVGEAATLGG